MHRFALPAIGSRIVRSSERGPVQQCYAARFLNGGNAGGIAGRRAVIHLVACGIHDIISTRAGCLHRSERIGAGRDALRLERFQGRAAAHFVRQDTAEVILHEHMHDHIQPVRAAALYGQETNIARIAVGGACLRDHYAAGLILAVPEQAEIRAHV